MRLLLIFRDRSRPDSQPLAEAEIRAHDFRYYQEQLAAVPMNNSCSRLEFSLPMIPRTLHSDFANLRQEHSHFDSALHRLTVSLRLRDTRKDASLDSYLRYMVENLGEEFLSQPENVVVTVKTHPLNGKFKESVHLRNDAWKLYRPALRLPEARALSPAYALTA